MFRIAARTVLELGAELISKDIIAFYELIKNGFDAGSKTGVEVRFNVVLRRNAYLALRQTATGAKPPDVAELVVQLGRQLDASGPIRAAGDELRARCAKAKTHAAFVTALDDAYRELNTIEVLDAGSGMSAAELGKNGSPDRFVGGNSAHRAATIATYSPA